MISSVILGLGFSNKHEFATLFLGGAFTLLQGRKEAPNIILFCIQSALYVKMEFEQPKSPQGAPHSYIYIYISSFHYTTCFNI